MNKRRDQNDAAEYVALAHIHIRQGRSQALARERIGDWGGDVDFAGPYGSSAGIGTPATRCGDSCMSRQIALCASSSAWHAVRPWAVHCQRKSAQRSPPPSAPPESFCDPSRTRTAGDGWQSVRKSTAVSTRCPFVQPRNREKNERGEHRGMIWNCEAQHAPTSRMTRPVHETSKPYRPLASSETTCCCSSPRLRLVLSVAATCWAPTAMTWMDGETRFMARAKRRCFHRNPRMGTYPSCHSPYASLPTPHHSQPHGAIAPLELRLRGSSRMTFWINAGDSSSATALFCITALVDDNDMLFFTGASSTSLGLSSSASFSIRPTGVFT